MLERPVKIRMILYQTRIQVRFLCIFPPAFHVQCIAEMGGVTLKVCRKKVVMISSMNAV